MMSEAVVVVECKKTIGRYQVGCAYQVSVPEYRRLRKAHPEAFRRQRNFPVRADKMIRSEDIHYA
jgi:hypothetical protein